jgi:hypothetical protein
MELHFMSGVEVLREMLWSVLVHSRCEPIRQPQFTKHTCTSCLTAFVELSYLVFDRNVCMQVGVDAAAMVVDDDTDNLADGKRPIFGIGDSQWALDRASVRGTYTATSARHFTGEPESYQLGVSVENLGEKFVASYFHHLAIREAAAAEPYWRGVSFGGEVVHLRDTDVDVDR